MPLLPPPGPRGQVHVHEVQVFRVTRGATLPLRWSAVVRPRVIQPYLGEAGEVLASIHPAPGSDPLSGRGISERKDPQTWSSIAPEGRSRGEEAGPVRLPCRGSILFASARDTPPRRQGESLGNAGSRRVGAHRARSRPHAPPLQDGVRRRSAEKRVTLDEVVPQVVERRRVVDEMLPVDQHPFIAGAKEIPRRKSPCAGPPVSSPPAAR